MISPGFMLHLCYFTLTVWISGVEVESELMMGRLWNQQYNSSVIAQQ